LQDYLALFAREHACEWTRLSQAGGLFIIRSQQRSQFSDGCALEQMLPFEQRRLRPTTDPAGQVRARHLEQLGTGFNLGRDGLVQRQTSTVDPGVGAHATSVAAFRPIVQREAI
jgi:hypothetical protein